MRDVYPAINVGQAVGLLSCDRGFGEFPSAWVDDQVHQVPRSGRLRLRTTARQRRAPPVVPRQRRPRSVLEGAPRF